MILWLYDPWTQRSFNAQNVFWKFNLIQCFYSKIWLDYPFEACKTQNLVKLDQIISMIVVSTCYQLSSIFLSCQYPSDCLEKATFLFLLSLIMILKKSFVALPGLQLLSQLMGGEYDTLEVAWWILYAYCNSQLQINCS